MFLPLLLSPSSCACVVLHVTFVACADFRNVLSSQNCVVNGLNSLGIVLEYAPRFRGRAGCLRVACGSWVVRRGTIPNVHSKCACTPISFSTSLMAGIALGLRECLLLDLVKVVASFTSCLACV